MAIGDFEKAKTSLQEKINEAEQEGEISANFTEFESLKQQMDDLEAKKDTYDGVVENAEAGATENQVAQVTDLGGSEEELNKRLEEKNEGVENAEAVVEETPNGGTEGEEPTLVPIADIFQFEPANEVDYFAKENSAELIQKKFWELLEKSKKHQTDLEDSQRFDYVKDQMLKMVDNNIRLDKKMLIGNMTDLSIEQNKINADNLTIKITLLTDARRSLEDLTESANEKVENAEAVVEETTSDSNTGLSSKNESVKESKEKPLSLEELKEKVNSSRELIVGSSGVPMSEKLDVYNSLGNIEEANKIKEALAKDYEERGFLDWSADYYSELGNKGKAKELWEKSLGQMQYTDDPAYRGGNYFHAASIQEKLGDKEGMNKSLAKYLEINEKIPDSDKNYSGIAGVYEKLGNSEKAKQMWEESAKKWEKNSSKLESAGESYEKAGNREKAEECYKKAIVYQEDLRSKNTSTGIDEDRLAKAYMATGQKDKAIEMLNNEAEKLAARGGNSQYIYHKLGKYL